MKDNAAINSRRSEVTTTNRHGGPADPTVGVKFVIVGALATPSLITVNGVLLVVEPLGVELKPMPATVAVVPTGPLFGVN
jgi:hypothetical protein